MLKLTKALKVTWWIFKELQGFIFNHPVDDKIVMEHLQKRDRPGLQSPQADCNKIHAANKVWQEVSTVYSILSPLKYMAQECHGN